MEDIDLNTLGFVIVGMFVATWAVALAIWRSGGSRSGGAPNAAALTSRGSLR